MKPVYPTRRLRMRSTRASPLAGPPERLDADDTDELWDFVSECGAPQVAAGLSIDPVWTG